MDQKNGNVVEIDFPARSFDAVVSLHAIIHVPRTHQRALVARIARWLKPGGVILAAWALNAWECFDEDWEG